MRLPNVPSMKISVSSASCVPAGDPQMSPSRKICLRCRFLPL